MTNLESLNKWKAGPDAAFERKDYTDLANCATQIRHYADCLARNEEKRC
jgi:hypothetical protein